MNQAAFFMSGKHYFSIITMRVAKAIIRYNVSKVLMTLSSFLIDRKLRTAKVRLMPFYHIRYPAHKKRAAFGPPFSVRV